MADGSGSIPIDVRSLAKAIEDHALVAQITRPRAAITAWADEVEIRVYSFGAPVLNISRPTLGEAVTAAHDTLDERDPRLVAATLGLVSP